MTPIAQADLDATDSFAELIIFDKQRTWKMPSDIDEMDAMAGSLGTTKQAYIGAEELGHSILAAFERGGVQPDRGNVHVMDRAYFAPSIDKMRAVVNKVGKNRMKYAADAYDCDDYATHLASAVRDEVVRGNHADGKHNWAFGIVAVEMPDGAGHAMNVTVDDTGTVWIVDPQTLEFTRASEYKELKRHVFTVVHGAHTDGNGYA